MGGKQSIPTSPSTEKSSNVQAGDGLRSLRTTSVFRAVNFELYVKPNLVVMTFGIVAIIGSAGYLAYMNAQHLKSKTYVAIAEDGSQQLYQKRSKWD